MKKKEIKRLLEIIPGFLSWSVILFLILLFIFKPFAAAVVIIIYLIYWLARLFYMTCLMLLANYRIRSFRKMSWLSRCAEIKSDIDFKDVLQVVLYPTYKEPPQVLIDSLNALKGAEYPREKILVVLAGEAREAGSFDKLDKLREKFSGIFKDIFITIHPKDTPGEIPSKGANATYASREIKKYLEKQNIDFAKVIISCFDADTCPDKNYFACLAYHFLTNKNRHQISYQPLPVYNNNIYKAPALARVLEMGSMFWQFVEMMRSEKFITFSSHSMSFKTLVEVDYWPVDLVSDDSLIFWKCFLKFNGDYHTYPLEVPVYMDIAVGKNIVNTFVIQYKQKRRWAWGVENFAFVGMGFLENKRIGFFMKMRKLYHLLDNHVNWATWAIVVSFITPFILYRGTIIAKDSLVLFNLAYINKVIFNSLTFMMLICIVMSRQFVPARPKNVSRFFYVRFIAQWFILPFVSAVLGSLPSLDAQTRMMFGNYLGFNVTKKRR